MNTFVKAGFLFMAAFLLSAETPRKTSSDFLMESYSSQLKKQLAMNAADYRAGQYRSLYEKCGPNHDCHNITAGEMQRKGIINVQKAEEAKEKFPFMGIPMGQ